MTRLLAAVDNSTVARPVLETAAALAPLYAASVEALHVVENGSRVVRAAAAAAGIELHELPDGVVDSLIEAGRQADVAALVMGIRAGRLARRPLGHVTRELLGSVRKPLVLVPPETRTPFRLERVLVPLNGTTTTAAALAGTVEVARGGQVEVDVLYIHGESSVPLFDDQPQHEMESFAREFVARYCSPVEVPRLHVRVGWPGEHVLSVAEEIGADLIALGWKQDLSAGRAAVVREALGRSRVPVLLVPVAARTGMAKSGGRTALAAG
jgi:nucleotide-binding universal stress UspA family protein